MGRKNKMGEELLPLPIQMARVRIYVNVFFFFLCLLWDVIHVVNLSVTQDNRGSGVLKHLNCCAHKELPKAGVADFCSGLAQAGACGQGGDRAASSLAQRVLVTMHTSSQPGRSSGLVIGIPECALEETREGTMIFSSSASNFLSRQMSDVFKEVISLLPSLQNPLPCYFFLLGLCTCGTVLCNGINSPPHNWAVCALLHGDW